MSELSKIITELQVNGISSNLLKRATDYSGKEALVHPYTDHRALTIEGKTVMVPVYNHYLKNLIINFQRSLTDNLFSKIVKIQISRNYLPQKNQVFIL